MILSEKIILIRTINTLLIHGVRLLNIPKSGTRLHNNPSSSVKLPDTTADTSKEKNLSQIIYDHRGVASVRKRRGRSRKECSL